MGNDCWNDIIVLGNANDIKNFEKEFKKVPNDFLKISVNKEHELQFSIWSKNQPDFEWLENLLIKYPSCWIKNLWQEEGGSAGVWIGSKDGIQKLDWIQMPFYINLKEIFT